jgi:hypothetical protein
MPGKLRVPATKKRPSEGSKAAGISREGNSGQTRLGHPLLKEREVIPLARPAKHSCRQGQRR